MMANEQSLLMTMWQKRSLHSHVPDRGFFSIFSKSRIVVELPVRGACCVASPEGETRHVGSGEQLLQPQKPHLAATSQSEKQFLLTSQLEVD